MRYERSAESYRVRWRGYRLANFGMRDGRHCVSLPVSGGFCKGLSRCGDSRRGAATSAARQPGRPGTRHGIPQHGNERTSHARGEVGLSAPRFRVYACLCAPRSCLPRRSPHPPPVYTAPEDTAAIPSAMTAPAAMCNLRPGEITGVPSAATPPSASASVGEPLPRPRSASSPSVGDDGAASSVSAAPSSWLRLGGRSWCKVLAVRLKRSFSRNSRSS